MGLQERTPEIWPFIAVTEPSLWQGGRSPFQQMYVSYGFCGFCMKVSAVLRHVHDTKMHTRELPALSNQQHVGRSNHGALPLNRWPSAVEAGCCCSQQGIMCRTCPRGSVGMLRSSSGIAFQSNMHIRAPGAFPPVSGSSM